ncbi:MAG: hypothetical protein K8T91_24940 [Planctomycetes bacterium]|nr:hypothetical protein [Planctomycetota bacterium]
MEITEKEIEPGLWHVSRGRPTQTVVGMGLNNHLADDPPNWYRFTNYGPGTIFITTHPEISEGTDFLTAKQSIDLYTNYAVIRLLPNTWEAEGTYQTLTTPF